VRAEEGTLSEGELLDGAHFHRNEKEIGREAPLFGHKFRRVYAEALFPYK